MAKSNTAAAAEKSSGGKWLVWDLRRGCVAEGAVNLTEAEAKKRAKDLAGDYEGYFEACDEARARDRRARRKVE